MDSYMKPLYQKKIPAEIVRKHLWAKQILLYCQHAKIRGFHGFLLFLPVSIAFSQMSLDLAALAYIIEALLNQSLPSLYNPLNRPLFIYIGVTLLATILSFEVAVIYDIVRSLFLIGVLYITYLSIPNVAQLKKAIRILTLSITLAALYGILQHYLEVDPLRFSRPIIFLSHINNDLHAPVRSVIHDCR